MSRQGESRVDEQAESEKRLVGLVPNKGNDHAVQVEEEQDEVEAELGEGFLRPRVSSGFLRSRRRQPVRTFLCTFNFLKISVASRRCVLSIILHCVSAVLASPAVFDCVFGDPRTS